MPSVKKEMEQVLVLVSPNTLVTHMLDADQNAFLILTVQKTKPVSVINVEIHVLEHAG